MGTTPPDVEDFAPLVAAFKATQGLLDRYCFDGEISLFVRAFVCLFAVYRFLRWRWHFFFFSLCVCLVPFLFFFPLQLRFVFCFVHCCQP